MSAPGLILTTFRFDVALSFGPGGGDVPRGDATDVRLGFQEVGGLELEMDAPELVEGGRNDGVVRRAGRIKSPSLVLKRGMFYDDRAGGAALDFWTWIQGIMEGALPVRRCDGSVTLKATPPGKTAPEPVCTWAFERGLPLKVKGPDLNARTGEVAIEELHIAHQGLRMLLKGRAA
jgi:phage tail-like protein